MPIRPPSTSIEIIKGAELLFKTRQLMTPFWDHADKKSLEKKYLPYYKNDLFFLVRKLDIPSLVAMGRLRPVTVSFFDVTYPLLGISDIRSIVQGKGYGKVLMQSIKEYLVKNKVTGIGFCNKKNTPFYIKSGFNIIKNAVQRFLYKNKIGNLLTDPDNDEDVLYIQGYDGLIKKIIEKPKEKIIIHCPHW